MYFQILLIKKEKKMRNMINVFFSKKARLTLKKYYPPIFLLFLFKTTIEIKCPQRLIGAKPLVYNIVPLFNSFRNIILYLIFRSELDLVKNIKCSRKNKETVAYKNINRIETAIQAMSFKGTLRPKSHCDNEVNLFINSLKHALDHQTFFAKEKFFLFKICCYFYIYKRGGEGAVKCK